MHTPRLNALLRTGLLVVLVSLLVRPVATAHIVPPEEFHPVAEAHRRLTFLVNLNPVLWEELKKDTDAIAAGYVAVSPADGGAYAEQVDAFFAAVEAEARVSSPTVTMRKQTARGIFEISTEAVASIIALHLESARESLSDYALSGEAFDAARQIWAAFEYEIKQVDLDGFTKMGRHWLAASSAMGVEAVFGVGGVTADGEVFNAETDAVIDFLHANYGKGYTAPERGPLLPLPEESPTFDPTATVAMKLPPGSNMNKQLPRPRQILNMVERGVSENDTALIALGDMAFDSAYIFGEPARRLQLSCNTCHNKGVTNPNFFIPGISGRNGGLDVSNAFFKPWANNGHFDPLDIPDLRGIRYTAPYGRNGRFASLREFTRNVIVNEFNGAEPNPILLDGLIAYMNEIDFLPNPYLRSDGTLSEKASKSAKRGEIIFTRTFEQMNAMSCASCHIPNSNFLDHRRHDIGSVDGAGVYSVDRALDTPTLLSVKFNGPYFHDGSLETLADVIAWFDRQYALGLSDGQRADLTSYVEAVGDGIDGYEDTMFTLESEMEEFSFFLSAYEFAKASGVPALLDATFQTIASEIRAHRWDVQDQAQLPVLNKMAALMDEAYIAHQQNDSDRVDALVVEYRKMYAENRHALN